MLAARMRTLDFFNPEPTAQPSRPQNGSFVDTCGADDESRRQEDDDDGGVDHGDASVLLPVTVERLLDAKRSFCQP